MPLPSSGTIRISQVMAEAGITAGTQVTLGQSFPPYFCGISGGSSTSLGASFYNQVQVTGPPAQPSWTTWGQSTTTITVYWYAVDKATNYYVSCSNGGAAYTGTNTYFGFGGFSPGSSYTFYVYAINCKGNSSQNSVNIGTQPNPVTSITLNSSGSYNLNISWSAPTGASYYYLSWPGGATYVYGTSYNITGLTPYTQYLIYVYSISPYNVWGSWYNQYISTTGFSDGLYPFNYVTFTPGGQTGAYGPTLSTARAGLTNGAPSPSNWYNSYLTMTTQGIQKWTVPATGTYTIKVAGAAGGASVWYTQGYGAVMQGNFNLPQGAVLYILVGQRGQDNGDNYHEGGGGGGGSFVVQSPYNTVASCLIAAGGGGGGGASGISNDPSGLTSTAGGNRPNYITPYQICGTGGDNGGGGGGAANGGGCGGAGFCGNGGKGASYAGYGYQGNGGGSGANGCGNGGDATYSVPSTTYTYAQSFINGGVGGQSSGAGNSWGGFGGGGGAEGTFPGGAGGGGGYSGGGGSGYTGYAGSSYYYNSGLGGGSINRGTSQTNTAGSNNDVGYVTITRVS